MDLEQSGSQFAPEVSANSAKTYNEYHNLDDVGSIWFGHNLFGDIKNFFDGYRNKMEDEYQTYLLNNQREYEQQNLVDARKFQDYMESTKYQRTVKDLEKAGLNPYMMVQSGLGSTSVSSSSPSYSTSAMKYRSKDKDGDKADNLVNAALRILGILAITSA